MISMVTDLREWQASVCAWLSGMAVLYSVPDNIILPLSFFIMNKVRSCLRTFSYLLFLLAFLEGCVAPVEPEYDYQDNILFIDAYALSEPGLSSVSVKRSIYINESYFLEDEPNARVSVVNIETGRTVEFLEDTIGQYLCPPDFAVAVGETWMLDLTLQDGRHFESKPERITEQVPFGQVNLEYSDQVQYHKGFDRYIPGHRISVDWTDPPGEKNYYLWKYRSYEPLMVCKLCENSILREGFCKPIWVNFDLPDYDYLCDTPCWRIRYSPDLPIFEDVFSDGARIVNREIAIIPFYRAQDILVEVQQLSINESAFKYFSVINDLLTENTGLNAPPPAALFGNLFNPENPDEVVLGNFTAAAVSIKRLFIERKEILDHPLTPDHDLTLENCLDCPTTYPCMESFSRTSTKPAGWP